MGGERGGRLPAPGSEAWNTGAGRGPQAAARAQTGGGRGARWGVVHGDLEGGRAETRASWAPGAPASSPRSWWGLGPILLFDRHWGGGAQEAGGVGAQAPQGWPSWRGGDIVGCWGWLWRRRRLLLLVHFALLCPPVLEPDLHLWGQRTEMGWGQPDDSERKAGPAVGLLFLDGAPGPPPTPLPQPSRDPSTTPPELAPRLLRQLSLQPSSSSSPKAMSLLLQEAFPLPPGLRSLLWAERR